MSFSALLSRTFRGLSRAPGFTLAAVLTLALGMGGALALFAALHGAMLRTPPYPGAERLYQVRLTQRGKGVMPNVSAIPVREMAAATPEVEALGCITRMAWSGPSLLETATGRLDIPTAWVDAGVLPILGLAPRLGSGFTPASFASGEGVVLTHAFWKEHFGGDPGVVGRSLPLLGGPQPILGVLGADAELPFHLQARLVRPLPPLAQNRRGEFRFTALVRLRRGADPRAVEHVFRQVYETQLQDYPRNTPPERRPALVPLKRAMAGEAERGFGLVCGAAGLLLLLAATNVAALFLNRAARRSGDMAIRLSLGAGPRHLLAETLPESLGVACVAALLGLLMASQMGGLLRAWLPGADRLHGLGHAWAHPAVALFALGLVLGLGLILGLMPLAQVRRLRLEATLRASAGTGRSSHRVRDGLVVAQLAFATLLLFGVGLMGRSLFRLVNQPLGFDPKGLVLVELEPRSLPQGVQERRAPSPSPAPLLAALASRPGIQRVALCGNIPGDWDGNLALRWGFSAQNYSGGGVNASRDLASLETSERFLGVESVSQGYLETLGLAMRSGRAFTAEDLGAQRRVCVIDEAAARAFFPEGALGKRLHLGIWDDFVVEGGLKEGEPLEVVGVVAGYANQGAENPAVPSVYLPATLMPPSRMLLRASLGAKDLKQVLDQVLLEHFPDQRVRDLQTLQAYRWERALPRRQVLALLLPFGAVALLLAALGLGTLMGSQVTQRTREFGIRMALGATSGALLYEVLARALLRAALGIGAGMLLAFALLRTLESLLYGVGLGDPAALAGAASVLLATAALAALLPALRAARVAPAEALRSE